MRVHEVRFASGDDLCVADLYLPDPSSGRRFATIVMAPGFSAVRSVLAAQAERFVENGYAVLAFDYRHFGESGGAPRQHMSPWRQVEDYRNALSFCATRAELDPDLLILWGSSFAGGLVLAAGALDRRVKAVLSQVPVIDGCTWLRGMRSLDQWERLLALMAEDRGRRFRGEEGDRIDVSFDGARGEVGVVCDPDGHLLMEFLEAHHPSFVSSVTLASLDEVVAFSVAHLVPRVGPRPLCMLTISGYDVTHPQADFQDAYRSASEPKSVVVLPVDQLGLGMEVGVDLATDAFVGFLERFVPADGSRGRTPPVSALPA